MEKPCSLKVLKTKLIQFWILYFRSKSFGEKVEELLRLLVVIWIMTRTSKCFWLADYLILASHLNLVQKQLLLTSLSLKVVFNNSYLVKLFLMSKNHSKTVWILSWTMSMLTRKLFKNLTKIYFKDLLNHKVISWMILLLWRCSITQKLKLKRLQLN